MKNTIIVTIIVAVFFGAGGFFVGTKYQQSQRPAFNRQFGNQPNGQINQRIGNGQGRMGFAPVSGEITNVDGQAITVKLNNGSSKIVLYSDSTEVNKAEAGTKEDLKNGEKVMVIGTSNTDGSVTAQSIQLNPVFRNVNPSEVFEPEKPL